jgi:ammonium transporter, Amt family
MPESVWRFSLACGKARTIIDRRLGLAGGAIIYGSLRKTVGLRLDHEDEFNGADITIHRITATPERESGW